MKKTNFFILTLFLIILVFGFPYLSFSQSKPIIIKLLPNEYWWGGISNKGDIMPLSADKYTFNYLADDDGNQTSPLLISNKGRYIWSEKPYRFTFDKGLLTIDKSQGKIIQAKAGATLKSAYADLSAKYFPSTGKWPDSTLVTAPQYNLWIELQYRPTQADVLNYAQKVLDNGFPPGVIMIDDNWSSYYGQFDFDKEKFPNPKGLIDQLHQMGFKVMVWICPFISPDNSEYRELVAKKLILMDNQGNKNITWQNAEKPLLLKWWNGYSTCIDLSNPDAQAWMQAKLDNLQSKYGVDGYKLDAGDAVYYSNPNMISFKKALANEHSTFWAEVGLKYPLNEYRAVWKMGGQPLVQRLRDKTHSWEALQTLIPNSFVQQLMGYTFTCPDMIGGGEFTSFLPGSVINQKLMVRSAQVAAFMPMMQFSAAPWRVLDKVHFDATKKIVAVRQLHMPYIMEVMRNSAKTGMPAMTPLEYNFPNQGFEKTKDQFMLGHKLMIAPVITKNDSRMVKIPKGSWKYKNETYTGPLEKTFNVDLDELLVFKLVE